MAHLKGQNVNLILDDTVIAASKSCDFSITANTADGAAKDDANPMWDNPAFTYCDWSASNESFIVDIKYLHNLLYSVATGNCEVQLQWQCGEDSAIMCKKGKAVITNLELDAPSDDYASLSLSFEGASGLSDGSFTTITPATTLRNKLRGKALMIAVNTTPTEGTATYKTICAATSHKLSFSAQTSDTKTKDDNDKAISKEVTGKSLTLSTENLITLHESAGECETANALLGETLNGNTLSLIVGYYPGSIGNAVDGTQNWGDPTASTTATETGEVVISGSFLCSSWSVSGANKEDATMSAEFTLQGAPTISQVA